MFTYNCSEHSQESKTPGAGELLALPEGTEWNNPSLHMQTNPPGSTGD